jgi:hypothetical protein
MTVSIFIDPPEIRIEMCGVNYTSSRGAPQHVDRRSRLSQAPVFPVMLVVLRKPWNFPHDRIS